MLYGALLLSLMIRYRAFDAPLFAEHLIPFSILFLFWLVVFYVLDLYDLSTPPSSAPFLRRFIAALSVCLVIGIILFYIVAVGGLSPKTILLIDVLLTGALTFVWRLVFARMISPLVPWRIGLYALGTQAAELERIIASHKQHGYECVRFDEGTSLSQWIHERRLQVVVIPASFYTDTSRLQSLYECLETGVSFLDISQAYETFARRLPLTDLDEQWFIRNLQEEPRGLYRRVKRTFDLLVATLIILSTSPAWVLMALAIKLDGGGSVLYTQVRLGKHRVPFLIKKFRTMRDDAEASGAQWASKNDPRVTRVGKWLRRTHLDELPQMLNVLKGELSLVGPRPERPMFVEQLEREVPYYRVRHFVQPGFTGWAQIKFRYARSVTDSRTKFEYDLYYIKNRSLILDALILLKTIQLFFRNHE